MNTDSITLPCYKVIIACQEQKKILDENLQHKINKIKNSYALNDLKVSGTNSWFQVIFNRKSRKRSFKEIETEKQKIIDRIWDDEYSGAYIRSSIYDAEMQHHNKIDALNSIIGICELELNRLNGVNFTKKAREYHYRNATLNFSFESADIFRWRYNVLFKDEHFLPWKINNIEEQHG